MTCRIPALRRIARSLFLAIVVSVAAGCYDTGFRAPAATVSEEAVTLSIADLRERFSGNPVLIQGDISIEGVVVSSDRAGNFYRTLCIQQEQSALEIMAGVDQLHNEFPVGCRVIAHLDGLVVARSRGVLQVGCPPLPGSGYDTDYIGSWAALERILVRRSEQLQPPEPARMTIPELVADRCGTLVRIDNLRYLPKEEEVAEETTGTEDNCWSGYRRFVDEQGREILTYVRTYADFADQAIPDGVVSLVGILQCDSSTEGRFVIKPRDEKDCLH